MMMLLFLLLVGLFGMVPSRVEVMMEVPCLWRCTEAVRRGKDVVGGYLEETSVGGGKES